MLFVGASSLLAAIFNQKPYFHLQLHPHITIHHQVDSALLFAIASALTPVAVS